MNELLLYSKNIDYDVANYGLDLYDIILFSLLDQIKMDENTKNTIIKFLLTEQNNVKEEDLDPIFLSSDWLIKIFLLESEDKYENADNAEKLEDYII